MLPKLPVVLAALCLLAACNKAEQIPAYLEIKPFEIQDPGGAAEHEITDGWVYLDGNLLGGYTLPATIPVLADGPHTVRVFAGVKENGITATPGLYPVLERYEAAVNFAPNQTVTLQPVTRTSPQAVAVWSAEQSAFDIGSVPLQGGQTGDTFTLTTDGAYAGRSVLIEVDTADQAEILLTELVELPNTGSREIWLELHYRNDVPFGLWVVGETGEVDRPVFLFNNSPQWNKIYINLTPFVAQAPLEPRYRLRFAATLPTSAGSPVRGAVWLDNMKLLYI